MKGECWVCHVLESYAIPCGKYLLGNNFMLQQEDDPKHTSKQCQHYLENKTVNGILTVMQSQNVNPSGPLLEQLDHMVLRKNQTSQSILWDMF